MEIKYSRQGDYLLPNLKLPEQPNVELGYWAQMREDYLEKHRKAIYTSMRIKCTLIPHLADVQERAEKMEEMLTKQMMEKEGVTEELKKQDQMKWVQMMNNIQNRVREIVMNEVIFVR